jgi:exonuclease SbcC
LKIRSLVLENIRSHKLNQVELDSGVTVFTGRTGSGKSTLLMGIEYALFGTEGGISNSAILRRGSNNGAVKLTFEENGDMYTIIRGLKRQGKNINIDQSNLALLKNDKQVPIMDRARDLNAKILEILDYPSDIKPKDLFETTSYTRQDEIRVLVEMTSENRQEHIDKILQLSKYKLVWENMKDVLNHFEKELAGSNARLEQLEKLRENLAKSELKILSLDSEIKKDECELQFLKVEYEKASSSAEKIESSIKDLLNKRREYDELNGKISRLQKEMERTKGIISLFSEKETEIRTNLKKIGNVEEFEELQTKNIEIVKTIELLTKELDKLEDEFKNLKELGEGNCPVCKQKVTKAHLDQIDKEYTISKNRILENIKSKQKENLGLEPKMRASKIASKLKEDLNKITGNLDEQNKNIGELNSEFKSLDFRFKEITIDHANVEKQESLLKREKANESIIYAKIQSITNINSRLKLELDERKSEFETEKETVLELEKSKESIERARGVLETLNRLRNDIKNIREVIRNNFLEDFRQEFQRKFEEIRKYEEEYTVDITKDYEPLAFTSEGEEVPITNLSGGEKTSVALAYRLALADLAAQVSSINPSEILILDEPTVGFDQDDIKALPSALRNIKTIPQILIVTHEEELKNAADFKYKVLKSSGLSQIIPEN